MVESLLPPPLWFLHEFSESSDLRPDSRLGRRGKKLAESRKVGKWESREIAISEISWFFTDFLILENAKIWDFKEHPFDFSGKVHIDHFSTLSENNSRICGKIKEGAFEIAIFRHFPNKEIHEKSRNFWNRDFATFPLSHFPTLGSPAENLSGGRLIQNDRL